jgi:Gram-negative bacterial TonB protein C-terminal
MVSPSNMEQAEPATRVSGFGSHVEELQTFFRSRGVSFGSVADLGPFMERLQSDASFRDETASMVRAIIYRERDGISRLELMELLVTSVGGAEVSDTAAPDIREAIGKLMAFVEGVFRTRWNPGAAAGSGPAVVPEEPERAPTTEDATAVHSTTDVFYRAQVVANGGVAETLTEERRASASVPLEQSEPLEAPRQSAEQWHIPLEGFGASEPERGSRVWLWIAGVCALLLAFSAGLFVRQRLLVPLRDPNQPYEASPAEPAGVAAAQPPAAAAQPAVRPSGTTVDADWRARAATNRSEGGVGVATRKGGVAPSASASEASMQPRYVVPGMIGASPALMAGYLVYAPEPQYPALARMTHVQGKVMVEAVVGKNGEVIRAQAISGHRLLRGAAVREVYGRRYRPYLLDDRPRDVATIVSVDFRLK